MTSEVGFVVCEAMMERVREGRRKGLGESAAMELLRVNAHGSSRGCAAEVYMLLISAVVDKVRGDGVTRRVQSGVEISTVADGTEIVLGHDRA